LAKDGEGRPVLPALYELYRQADTSGHEIQIEISTQRATLRAVGFCRMELHTEGAPKEVILIRLNLGMIDRAYAPRGDATFLRLSTCEAVGRARSR